MNNMDQKYKDFNPDDTAGKADDTYTNNIDMEDDDDSNQDGTVGRKSNRRTKDAQGRDFRCNYCQKTYLSYPALYTHLKNKHQGPDGFPVAAISAGRGRGRPKKTSSIFTPVPNYRHFDNTLGECFFQTPEKQGGPVFPDSGFAEVYSEIFIKKFEESKEDYSEDENDQSGHGQISEYMKLKKRGRKPKSFNIQKILDEQRQKEQIQLEQDIRKGVAIRDYDHTNKPDTSLGERMLEYKCHPLYFKLQTYSRENTDFII